MIAYIIELWLDYHKISIFLWNWMQCTFLLMEFFKTTKTNKYFQSIILNYTRLYFSILYPHVLLFCKHRIAEYNRKYITKRILYAKNAKCIPSKLSIYFKSCIYFFCPEKLRINIHNRYEKTSTIYLESPFPCFLRIWCSEFMH